MAETVRVLIEEEEVAKRIEELGKRSARIMRESRYTDLCPEGGVFFMCELAKRISIPVSMDFMSVSSYGDGTSSSGVVKIAKTWMRRWKEKTCW